MNDLGVLATMFGTANSVRKTELIRRSVFLVTDAQSFLFRLSQVTNSASKPQDKQTVCNKDLSAENQGKQ